MSEEGILFKTDKECHVTGAWFCNGCWELIMGRIKEDQNLKEK